jgi:hypothetical protein
VGNLKPYVLDFAIASKRASAIPAGLMVDRQHPPYSISRFPVVPCDQLIIRLGRFEYSSKIGNVRITYKMAIFLHPDLKIAWPGSRGIRDRRPAAWIDAAKDVVDNAYPLTKVIWSLYTQKAVHLSPAKPTIKSENRGNHSPESCLFVW